MNHTIITDNHPRVVWFFCVIVGLFVWFNDVIATVHQTMIRKKALRITFISLILIITLISSLVVYVGYSFYFSPLPQTSGIKRVEGLQAPVTIYRDSWAIPQIYASSTDDLFFTQGYVHAQDRWWQMELSRYLAAGRLRDILTDSDAVLAIDRWMLTLGLAESARQEWDNASPQTRAVLEAYSAGINAYVQSRSVESLASEYGLVGLTGELESLLIYLGRDVEIEEWEPYHSILLWKLFAFSITPSFWTELDLSIALRRDTSGSLLKLIDTNAALQTLPINDALLQLKLEDIVMLRDQMIGAMSPEIMSALGFSMLVGGNLWVVDGQHTDSGFPLLANDLHTSPEIPAIWYEMGLQCNTIQADCPYAVMGFSLAGVPGVVTGHNDQIAWGINPSRAKTQTLTLLELHPDNPLWYRDGGNWQAFTIETVPILTTSDEDSRPSEQQILHSVYGPLITEPTNGWALALDWAGFDSHTDMLGSLLQLNRADSWPAFQNALRGWVYPALQVAYADVEGNIGLQMAATLLSDEGTLFLFDQLPSHYNPASGIIIDANQVPTDIFLQGYWDLPWRAERIGELLNGQNNHSPDYFASLQGDQYNSFALNLMPYVQTLIFDDPELHALQQWLTEWDFRYRLDSSHAAFFAVFTDILLRLTFEQEFLAAQLSLYDIAPLLLMYLLPISVDTLWDTPETPFVEGRDDVLRQSFVAAYQLMRQQFGDAPLLWRWGDLHQVTFSSRVIGQRDLFGGNLAVNSGLFPINQDDVEIGGSFGSINHTRYTILSPLFDKTADSITLRVHTAPACRVIIDLANFNNSRAMLSTGQSGHPASGNYKDMIAPWRSLEYHDLNWGLAVVREVSNKRLELEPE